MLEQGQVIEGKYRIVDMIGVGGMGSVFEGENERIRRRVAIKVLHAKAAASKDAVERFEREAQAAGLVGSDHILEVLDLGTLESGEHFMVMEYLDGETLGKRIKRLGALAPQQVIPLVRQALAGLAAAHAAGIVHRDLKPENLFVCKEKAGYADFVKIIDFGVSKFNKLGGDGLSMTRTGAVMGTPYYMSPEQARGSREIDARSDLYSMGVILYEAVTGQVPFHAETFSELLFKIVLSEPVPLRQVRPDIDPGFESLTLKAMARDVEHRFQSAQDFIAALDNWMQTGAAVTIPPAVGHDAPSDTQTTTNVVPAGASAASVAAWSSSQFDAVPELKRGPRPLLLVAALGGLLILLAGGGLFAWRMVAAKRAAAVTDASATEAPLGSASAPVEASGAAPEPDTPAEGATPVEAPSAPTPPDPAKPVAAAPAPKPVVKPVTNQPASKPTPGPKPPPKPGPKPPDFGY
ncbi:MAG TPA: serine/threonine-protein kinase [Polyangiaceae bacterium]|nr:serine/threonine-protein kinase [Polyangiaceae bacterium]